MADHKARTIKGQTIGGWYSKCSCGWAGPLHGFKGARTQATEDRNNHYIDTDEAETTVA